MVEVQWARRSGPQGGRERGAEGGVRALSPRAAPWAIHIAPLTGLKSADCEYRHFFNELTTQDTST